MVMIAPVGLPEGCVSTRKGTHSEGFPSFLVLLLFLSAALLTSAVLMAPRTGGEGVDVPPTCGGLCLECMGCHLGGKSAACIGCISKTWV